MSHPLNFEFGRVVEPQGDPVYDLEEYAAQAPHIYSWNIAIIFDVGQQFLVVGFPFDMI